MRRKALLLSALAILLSLERTVAEEYQVDELVHDLRDGGVEERWQAARLLGTLGGRARPSAIYLTMALWDENRTVRYYAARSLAAIGPAVGDIAGANLLELALHDPNRYVREEAGTALRVVDPIPLFLKVPWLYAQMEGEPKDLMSAFRVRRYKMISELSVQLRHEDVEQRRDAATMLVRLRWRAAPATEALVVALRDEDEIVRFSAAQALGQIGSTAYLESKESLLYAAAKDPSKRVREQAEQTLQSFLDSQLQADESKEFHADSSNFVTRSSLRKALPPSEDRLTMQVISPDLTQRREATWDLARLRPTDHLTRRYLCRALVDDDEIVRYNAVTALGRLGLSAGPLVVSSLEVVRLGETSPRVLQRAVLGKMLIDPDFAVVDSQAAEKRSELNREPADTVRRQLKSHDFNSWLLRLQGADVGEQIRAIRMLGKRGERGRDPLPKLTRYLSHSNPYVRMYAIESIGLLGFQRGSPVGYQLAQMADDERKDLVRNMAVEALLLNLDKDVVASLREPGPPSLPSPEPGGPVSPALSDRNIASLLQMLNQKAERSTALAILSDRLQSEKGGALFVPMAMSADRAVREIGMTALWDFSSRPGIAAPLAYAIQHNMGTAHHVEMINQIDVGQAHAPYLIPYVMRSDRPRIRQAGLRAWSRIVGQGDWRKTLTLPWQYHDDVHHRKAIAAVKSLGADDVAAQAFIAGGMTLRNDAALLKFVIELGAALREREHSRDRLTAMYRAEKSLKVRQAIVWQLAQEKPVVASVVPGLLIAVLTFEPDRSIREEVVRALRDYGSMAEESLPSLLRVLKDEESLQFQIKIVAAMKAIGAGDAKLQTILVHLEESLRIQQARELLGELVSEQAQLEEETRRRQKGLLLRSLAN